MMPAALGRPLEPAQPAFGAAAFGGRGDQVFDQLFDFLRFDDRFEVGRHHVGWVALGDLGVGIDDRFFDHRGGLAGKDFIEVGAGHAARFGRGQGVAATAAVVGEDLGAGAAGNFGRSRAGNACVEADVSGDVLEVLTGDDVGGHRDRRVAVARPRVLDLGLDDAFDRVATLAGFARRAKGIVEIGADLRCGPRLGQRVADAAFLDEEDASAGSVGAAGAAAGGGSAMAARAARASSGRIGFGSFASARGAPESICGPPRKLLVAGRGSGRLEAIHTNSANRRRGGGRCRCGKACRRWS